MQPLQQRLVISEADLHQTPDFQTVEVKCDTLASSKQVAAHTRGAAVLALLQP